MNLYSIALPVTSKGGQNKRELAEFEAFALHRAGGYTKRPDGEGAWRDPESGKVYFDTMRPYEIACDDTTWRAVVAKAFELFPEELAIYTALIGVVRIINRPK